MNRISRIAGRIVVGFVLLTIVSTVRSVPTASAADEVTCAWCIEARDLLNNTAHYFPNPGDLCGFPQPGGGEGTETECSRCGGTSSCHSAPQEGECHIACGGQGLATLEADLRRAIEAGDATQLHHLITEAAEGVTVELALDGGRVTLVAECDLTRPAATLALTRVLRDALELETGKLAAS